MATRETIPLDALSAIAGAERVRAATPADTVAGVAAQWVVEPADIASLARLLAWANAQGIAVIPRGQGTKLGWGTPPQAADMLLSTRGLDQIIEHAWGDMTITAEAGCTIGQIQATLAVHGQRLAIDPLWPADATLGGVLATNDNGGLRLRFGGLRDIVLGMTVALPDGTVAKSGGKVVKNVAGYDLQKLMTGAFGTLGVICAATLRVYPLPPETRVIHLTLPSFTDLAQFFDRLRASTLLPVSLTAQAGNDRLPSVALRFEGLPAVNDAQIARLREFWGGAIVEGGAIAPREALFTAENDALVARYALLPTQLGEWLTQVEHHAITAQVHWQIEGQATGTGVLRLCGEPTTSAEVFQALRRTIAAASGAIVALTVPPALRTTLDVWGPGGDTLPLMRRVKAQFDPLSTLNPGRYLGGI